MLLQNFDVFIVRKVIEMISLWILHDRVVGAELQTEKFGMESFVGHPAYRFLSPCLPSVNF